MATENLIVLDDKALERITEIATREFVRTKKTMAGCYAYALIEYMNMKGGKPGFVVKE